MTCPNRGCRKWCFTLNNPTDSDDIILKRLNTLKCVTSLVFQKEIAPTTLTPHYQGFIHFKDVKSLSAVKKLMGERVHLEMQMGSDLQNIKYCTKESSKTEGLTILKVAKNTDKNPTDIITDIKAGIKYKELVELHFSYFTKYNKSFHELYELYKPSKLKTIEIELYEWEKELIDIFRTSPKHRQVYWIWSSESNTGKTIFKQYCQDLFQVLDVNNFNFRDIVHTYNDDDIIWANLSRVDDIDATKLHVLEKLSDGGYCQSTKYEGSKKYIDSHIVVTSNHPPPFNLLPERIVEYNVSKKPIISNTENDKNPNKSNILDYGLCHTSPHKIRLDD